MASIYNYVETASSLLHDTEYIPPCCYLWMTREEVLEAIQNYHGTEMLLPNRSYGQPLSVTSLVRKQGNTYTIEGQFMCKIPTSKYSGLVSLWDVTSQIRKVTMFLIVYRLSQIIGSYILMYSQTLCYIPKSDVVLITAIKLQLKYK